MDLSTIISGFGLLQSFTIYMVVAAVLNGLFGFNLPMFNGAVFG